MKQNVEDIHIHPLCKEKIEIGIESESCFEPCKEKTSKLRRFLPKRP